MKGKPGRHVPAFVLLELAESSNYGLGILNQLKSKMPHCLLDTAGVYRALSSLESDGLITASIPDPNHQQKKLYEISELGKEALKEYHSDILMRHENLSFFLETYSRLEVTHDK